MAKKKYQYKVEQHNNITDKQLESILETKRDQGWTPVSVSMSGESVLVTYETWRKVK